MTRYLGGLITKDESLVLPANNFEDTSAPGVWTLEEAQALNKQGLWPTAGNANPSKSIENIFSIDLYTGNSGTQTITNGIDISGEGGLVWIKSRSDANHHQLYDTVRGVGKPIYSSLNNSEGTNTNFASFTSSGFTLGYTSANGGVNGNSSDTYVAYTFRKAPKFFDVVSWSGNNVDGRTISHNLGATPGFIMVKLYAGEGTENWICFHRSLTSNHTLYLNTTAAQSNTGFITNVTSTGFDVDNTVGVNATGRSYIAYIFGHDTSSDGMIQCGTFASDGSGNYDGSTALGFEPQWFMWKSYSATDNWPMIDSMRGYNRSLWDVVYADASNAGSPINSDRSNPTPQGFIFRNGQLMTNQNYLYMAIRKGRMATPTSSSNVFGINAFTAGSSTSTIYDLGIKHDMVIASGRAGSGVTTVDKRIQSRITGMGVVGKNAQQLVTTGNSTENGRSDFVQAASSNNAVQLDSSIITDTFLTTGIFWAWSNAKGFFDSVTYTGNESSGRQIAHNLGATPEMIWIKELGGTSNWVVYHKGLNGGTDPYNYVLTGLNNGYDEAYNTAYFGAAPTSTTFTIGNNQASNENSINHVAFLFASATGVSKVGSFSHSNGSSTDVDCGFSSGSKFVLVKDRDQGSDSGDWYVWDSTRGIVSGNDPYTLLNSDAAEVTNTDYIDTLSSGFQIASGFATGDYIFYAIAA
jgi:hypothetical protein